jgi:DNA-binding response OmpR family regulator
VRRLLAEPRPVPLLIAQHDPQRARAIASVLESAGFQVTVGEPVDAESFAGVVLGAVEGVSASIGVCQELRREGYLGAIVVFAEAGADVPALLDAGADDLVLSHDDAELIVRIQVALRRAVTRARARWGHVEVDRIHRIAYLRGAALPLTAREYALLCELLEAAGQPVSRGTLLAKVWGHDREKPATNVLEVHLSRLRDKLGDDARLIETVRGFGYRLRK